MIKYLMTAAALKAFSCSPQTKRVYRRLGNTFGQKRRIQKGLSKPYLERAQQILAVLEKYQAIQPGDTVLEIGTGWIHWESTIIRLFYDVHITLFDVWDNRQFGAYQRYFKQLAMVIDTVIAMDTATCERVHGLLAVIARATSFDELYEVLGFRYVVNPPGTLKGFEDEAFSAIYSCNVLEHIDKKILPEFVQDFYRVLRPGGFSIHKIDPGDHLAYSVRRGVCMKNYLRYPDNVWVRYFENDVQYFNRVQRSEWLHLFEEAGLDLQEEKLAFTDISTITIDQHYMNLSQEDLQCITLKVVHRKL